MNWKYIVVCLISIGIGFLFGWHSALESFRNYIVAILSWGLIISVALWGFNMWRELRKDKKDAIAKQKDKLEQEEAKKLEIKEKNRLEHSTKFIDVYLKNKVETNIGFDYTKCDLQIQVMNLDSTLRTIDNYNIQVCEYVEDHLKSGYGDIWEIIKKRDEEIRKHNTKAQTFLIDLKLKILSELQQRVPNIIEWNEAGERPTKYYTRHFLNQVGCSILWFYEHSIDKERLSTVFSIKNPETFGFNTEDRWVIYRDYDLIEINNKMELKEIKQIIIDILDNTLKSRDFILLKKCFESVKKRHESFKEEIIKIKINVDGCIPLKNECGVCKNY